MIIRRPLHIGTPYPLADLTCPYSYNLHPRDFPSVYWYLVRNLIRNLELPHSIGSCNTGKGRISPVTRLSFSAGLLQSREVIMFQGMLLSYFVSLAGQRISPNMCWYYIFTIRDQRVSLIPWLGPIPQACSNPVPIRVAR